ncbi:hypothetical protein [Marixanthomonas spongiae]|nr:hypothetical protein [Marixanthomonas spongiae]
MKTKLLFLGALLCLLVSTPLYAQKTKKVKQKEMKQIEVVKQPEVKIVPKKKRVIRGHIDPITGEQHNTTTNNSTDTRITIPVKKYRKIEFVDMPLLIKGTAKRNSEVNVTITTTYKKYGQEITKRKNINKILTNNEGVWGGVKIYSVEVDEADDKVTHKITAERVENDNVVGNTDTVTVYSNPKEITSIKITDPESNLYQGAKVTSPITVRGRAIKGHTVEIRVQTGQKTANNYNQSSSGSRLIKDWTPVSVNSQGRWSKQLNTGKPKTKNGRAPQSEYNLTILVRDKDNPSEVKTLWLRR